VTDLLRAEGVDPADEAKIARLVKKAGELVTADQIE
jgi:hypothetical protein